MYQLEIFVLFAIFTPGYGVEPKEVPRPVRGVICKQDIGHGSFYWNERCDYCAYAEGRHNKVTIYRHHACMRGKTKNLKAFTTTNSPGSNERISLTEFYYECQTSHCNDIGLGLGTPIFTERLVKQMDYDGHGEPMWERLKKHAVDFGDFPDYKPLDTEPTFH
uniref:Uncharacterized protein n=1 Tax=Panagrellus redivivus TaxID=6233 RepID=A0A7E4VWC2_PANRE